MTSPAYFLAVVACLLLFHVEGVQASHENEPGYDVCDIDSGLEGIFILLLVVLCPLSLFIIGLAIKAEFNMCGLITLQVIWAIFLGLGLPVAVANGYPVSCPLFMAALVISLMFLVPLMIVFVVASVAVALAAAVAVAGAAAGAALISAVGVYMTAAAAEELAHQAAAFAASRKKRKQELIDQGEQLPAEATCTTLLMRQSKAKELFKKARDPIIGEFDAWYRDPIIEWHDWASRAESKGKMIKLTEHYKLRGADKTRVESLEKRRDGEAMNKTIKDSGLEKWLADHADLVTNKSVYALCSSKLAETDPAQEKATLAETDPAEERAKLAETDPAEEKDRWLAVAYVLAVAMAETDPAEEKDRWLAVAYVLAVATNGSAKHVMKAAQKISGVGEKDDLDLAKGKELKDALRKEEDMLQQIVSEFTKNSDPWVFVEASIADRKKVVLRKGRLMETVFVDPEEVRIISYRMPLIPASQIGSMELDKEWLERKDGRLKKPEEKAPSVYTSFWAKLSSKNQIAPEQPQELSSFDYYVWNEEYKAPKIEPEREEEMKVARYREEANLNSNTTDGKAMNKTIKDSGLKEWLADHADLVTNESVCALCSPKLAETDPAEEKDRWLAVAYALAVAANGPVPVAKQMKAHQKISGVCEGHLGEFGLDLDKGKKLKEALKEKEDMLQQIEAEFTKNCDTEASLGLLEIYQNETGPFWASGLSHSDDILVKPRMLTAMRKLYQLFKVDCAYLRNDFSTNCNTSFKEALARGWIFQELANSELHEDHVKVWLQDPKTTTTKIATALVVRPRAMIEYSHKLLKRSNCSWAKLKLKIAPIAACKMTAKALKDEAQKDPSPLGLSWEDAGEMQPSSGVEITNPDLSEALLTKTSFELDEFKRFGIDPVNVRSYIKVERVHANIKTINYYQPSNRTLLSSFCSGRIGKLEDPCVATSVIAAYVSLDFRSEDDRLQAITQSLEANNEDRLEKFTKVASDEYIRLDPDAKKRFYTRPLDPKRDEVDFNDQMGYLAKVRVAMHTLAKLDKVEMKKKKARDDGKEDRNEVINGKASKAAGMHKFTAKIESKFRADSSRFYDKIVPTVPVTSSKTTSTSVEVAAVGVAADLKVGDELLGSTVASLTVDEKTMVTTVTLAGYANASHASEANTERVRKEHDKIAPTVPVTSSKTTSTSVEVAAVGGAAADLKVGDELLGSTVASLAVDEKTKVTTVTLAGNANSSHASEANTERVRKGYVPTKIRLPGLMKLYDENELNKLEFDRQGVWSTNVFGDQTCHLQKIKLVISKDKKSGQPKSVQVRPAADTAAVSKDKKSGHPKSVQVHPAADTAAATTSAAPGTPKRSAKYAPSTQSASA